MLRSVSKISGLASLAAPALAYALWQFDWSSLKSTYPDLPFMLTPIAALFFLAGLSLFMHLGAQTGSRLARVSQGLAFSVCALSVYTIFAYIWRDAAQSGYFWFNSFSGPTALLGEPSTHTATVFFLLGMSILLFSSDNAGHVFFAQFCVLVCSLIIFKQFFDFMAMVAPIREPFSLFGLSIASTVTLMILCVGVLFAHPDRGLMGVIGSDTAGGLMLRRVLPFTLSIPLVLGWLRVQGERAFWFDNSFGISLMVLMTAVFVNLIICWNARVIHRLDEDKNRHERALAEMNLNLESEVRRRTMQLHETNRHLTDEIAERQLREKEIADFLRERKLSQADMMKFATIVESSNDAIIAINLEGRIVSWNRGAEEMFGYFSGEILGKHIVHLVPKDRLTQEEKFFAEMRRGERINHYETIRLHKDGRKVHVSLNVSPIRDSDGKISAISLIARDITDKKRTEKVLEIQRKALQKSHQELDGFVYTASHDLRSPLRAISSFATFLQEDYEKNLDEKGKGYLSRIRTAAMRMTTLIDDLLTLSQISRMHNPFEDVDIYELVDAVTERLEFDIHKHNVKIEIDPKIPPIHCDRIKMTELFVNLIHNGIKFSAGRERPNPEIRISYRLRDAAHEFTVKDNGIGIDPEHHEKIFGFLKRLHNNKDYEGTGVGLAIVKRIVEDHQGEVWVDSKLGEGAAFHFTIPKMLKNRKKLGEILVEEGLIDSEKLKEVLEKQMADPLEKETEKHDHGQKNTDN